MKNLQVNKDCLRRAIKKTLKIVRNVTLGVVATFIIGSTAYSLKTHCDIEKIEYNSMCIDKITNHYENKGPIEIIALNDSQGININFCFWEKSFPEYIEEALSTNGDDVNLINTSSLKFNKTDHIDKILYENLNVEEIKLLNLVGAKSAFSKIAKDIGSPVDFGFMGALFCDKPKKGDEDINITDCLSNSNDPIILYFSGANDLMRELNNNPAAIKKYDEEGNIKKSFLYAENKSKCDQTLKNVISGIEENFQNIYAINKTSRIFALSIYVPVILDNEDMQPFVDLIGRYNIELEKLCKKYGAVYISNERIGELYSKNNGTNFHINEVGHKKLALVILESIRDNIDNTNTYVPTRDVVTYDRGLIGFAGELYQDSDNIPLDSILFDKAYLEYVKHQKEIEIYGEALLADKAETQYIKK